jgi:hypothetical protein
MIEWRKWAIGVEAISAAKGETSELGSHFLVTCAQRLDHRSHAPTLPSDDGAVLLIRADASRACVASLGSPARADEEHLHIADVALEEGGFAIGQVEAPKALQP